ncbi:MAG: hypothetical protein OER90_17815 [Gemmatimonadota bacterium]|nr:hypothetical protein [Gemmatimonadota bacterium]
MIRGGLVLSVTTSLVFGMPLAAQSDRCFFQVERVGRQGAQEPTGTGSFNYFAGGGVRLVCRNTGVSMESDSVAYYNGGEYTNFIGSVRYVDSTVTMTAAFGTYYKAGERWEARDSVVLVNRTNGSTLTGPSLDYYRAVTGFRPVEEMVAVGRPTIRYFGTDSTGRREEPYLIVADRVRMRGDDQMWAAGTVMIDRSDFAGRSDSLRLDTGVGKDGTLLGGPPELRGLGTDPYRLNGTRIDLTLNENADLTYVVAKESAHTVSDEWDLVADTIALDIENDQLAQMLAWGKRIRPEATSPEYLIRADSLALDTPNQVLRELRSFGTAWLGSAPDSVTGERDWMAGDTVIARFREREPGDTTKATLDRLEAYGSARSFRQIPDKESPCPDPSLNYVRGQTIIVHMKSPPAEEVDRVEIFGQVDGIQLEPCAQPSPADSTRLPAKPTRVEQRDSVAAPRDSTTPVPTPGAEP